MHLLDKTLAKEHSLRAVERCNILAQISEMKSGILRQYLTPAHKQCNQQVAKWMQQAGLKTWQDEVGNQWGRLSTNNPKAKSLIIGSHLDTVPNAGAYDGILGVLLAIEIAELANAQQLPLPFHLDIVGFADEEGTRFGTTLIGSKAIAGQFQSEWLDIRDANNITMAEALTEFGLSPESVNKATLDSEQVSAYWEVHIEQGPVLEAGDYSIGVVSAIAGAKRAIISFTGQAGHAGTTPMTMRQDALTAAAELVLAIEDIAKSSLNNEVATVGQIKCKPGATNVIAGYCEISLDARAQTVTDLQNLLNKISTQADQIASKRQLNINWQWTHQAEPVPCAENIQTLFKDACVLNKIPAPTLPSGAGHDAMALSDFCSLGMLFIRSPGGISHHPKETVISSDVENALTVLYSALSCQSA